MIKKYLKNRIVIIILLLIVFCIFNLFLSYSYYIATVLNNESETTVSIKSSGVLIVYENNSGYLEGNDFAPGAKLTKQFSIASNSKSTDFNTSKIWYNIRLIVEENTFSDNAIVCSLAVDSSSTQTGQTATEFTNKGIASGQNLDGMTLGAGYIVYGNVKHVYNLTIEYPAPEIYEINKTIRTHVIVEAVDTVNLNIDLDGGTFASGESISRVYGKNAIVVLEVPTKEGYQHIGWQVTSGNATANGNEITLGEGNVSIKALWKNLMPEPKSFAEDEWKTIAYYAQNPVDDKAPYEVGETRTITLVGDNTALKDKQLTIRIANNSNYNCTLDSKTACGFVVEFQDIITTHRMNATASNAGGWPGSELYGYVNTDIYNALPSDLRTIIIDTEVISGHSSTDSNSLRADGNWTSTDKLYLLSTKEVWSNCTESICNDSAINTTRQLDYYANLGVVTGDSNKYKEATKQYNGSNKWWWLRSAISSYYYDFTYVGTYGNNTNNDGSSSGGVSPAFRIG